MKTLPSDNVYPVKFDSHIHTKNGGITDEQLLRLSNGLTVREEFAVRAMQGILANENAFYADDPLALAQKSIACADALITELNKESK